MRRHFFHGVSIFVPRPFHTTRSFRHTNSFSIVCLWFFRPTRKIFHSCEDVTIAGEGLQLLTYARHSWPLSSEGSLACHTYCDTGHPFIIVISEDPRHSHLLPSVKQWSCHYLYDYRGGGGTSMTMVVLVVV